MPYTAGDHLRAAEFWKNLSAKQKVQLSDVTREPPLDPHGGLWDLHNKLWDNATDKKYLLMFLLIRIIINLCSCTFRIWMIMSSIFDEGIVSLGSLNSNFIIQMSKSNLTLCETKLNLALSNLNQPPGLLVYDYDPPFHIDANACHKDPRIARDVPILPLLDDPYTIEALVKPSTHAVMEMSAGEESLNCVAVWGQYSAGRKKSTGENKATGLCLLMRGDKESNKMHITATHKWDFGSTTNPLRYSWIVEVNDGGREHDKWVHLAATFDGKRRQLFVDFKSVASDEWDSAHGPHKVVDRSTFCLGLKSSKSIAPLGQVRGLKIFHRERTALEMRLETKEDYVPTSTTPASTFVLDSMSSSVNVEVGKQYHRGFHSELVLPYVKKIAGTNTAYDASLVSAGAISDLHIGIIINKTLRFGLSTSASGGRYPGGEWAVRIAVDQSMRFYYQGRETDIGMRPSRTFNLAKNGISLGRDSSTREVIVYSGTDVLGRFPDPVPVQADVYGVISFRELGAEVVDVSMKRVFSARHCLATSLGDSISQTKHSTSIALIQIIVITSAEFIIVYLNLFLAIVAFVGYVLVGKKHYLSRMYSWMLVSPRRAATFSCLQLIRFLNPHVFRSMIYYSQEIFIFYFGNGALRLGNYRMQHFLRRVIFPGIALCAGLILVFFAVFSMLNQFIVLFWISVRLNPTEWSPPQILMFLSLLNQLAHIVDVEHLEMTRLFLFRFGGADATWQLSEISRVKAFHTILFRRMSRDRKFQSLHGRFNAWVIVVCFDSRDLQKLWMREDIEAQSSRDLADDVLHLNEKMEALYWPLGREDIKKEEGDMRYMYFLENLHSVHLWLQHSSKKPLHLYDSSGIRFSGGVQNVVTPRVEQLQDWKDELILDPTARRLHRAAQLQSEIDELSRLHEYFNVEKHERLAFIDKRDKRDMERSSGSTGLERILFEISTSDILDKKLQPGRQRERLSSWSTPESLRTLQRRFRLTANIWRSGRSPDTPANPNTAQTAILRNTLRVNNKECRPSTYLAQFCDSPLMEKAVRNQVLELFVQLNKVKIFSSRCLLKGYDAMLQDGAPLGVEAVVQLVDYRKEKLKELVVVACHCDQLIALQDYDAAIELVDRNLVTISNDPRMDGVGEFINALESRSRKASRKKMLRKLMECFMDIFMCHKTPPSRISRPSTHSAFDAQSTREWPQMFNSRDTGEIDCTTKEWPQSFTQRSSSSNRRREKTQGTNRRETRMRESIELLKYEEQL